MYTWSHTRKKKKDNVKKKKVVKNVPKDTVQQIEGTWTLSYMDADQR